MSMASHVVVYDELSPVGATWEVTLPFTKPLSLNDRPGNHMVAARLKKTWHDATEKALREAMVPPMKRCRLTMVYIPRARRRHDEDNPVAAMKPIADAVVSAGIIPDDTREFMERVWPVIAEPDSKREGGRILVRVERLA